MSLNRVSIFKSIDASFGSLFCRVLGAINYLADGSNEIKPIRAENIKRILIIRPGGMGDMIVLLPVINHVKECFPEASIKIVCEKRNMEVLKLAGLEECALVYDAHPLKFLRNIFTSHFDIAIDTEQFHHFSAIFAILSGATNRLGFKINPRRNPLYTHLINYAPDGPEGMQFMKLLNPLPIKTAEYKLDGILKNEVADIEPKKEAPAPNTYAAIHMGTSNSYKLWGKDKYIELINTLSASHNIESVIVGDQNDAISANAVAESTSSDKSKTVSFAGKLDLLNTCKLMKDAKVFIGTDSGLAHLAIALGLPTIVMFGPSDQLKWGLTDKHHAVVKHDLPCSPCFIFGYHKPCKTIACMKSITVEDVATACADVLNS